MPALKTGTFNAVNLSAAVLADTGQDRLNSLARFLNLNQQLKEILAQPEPGNIQFLSDDRVSRIYDRKFMQSFDVLSKMISELGRQELGPKNLPEYQKTVIESFTRKLEQLKNQEAQIERGVGTVLGASRHLLANIRADFVTDIKQHLVGWQRSYFKPELISDLIDKVQTVNEMLHFMHVFALSNNNIFSALPSWQDQKLQELNRTGANRFNFCGDRTPEANDIASEMIEMKFRYSDKDQKTISEWRSVPPEIVALVSVADQINLQVRDFGHATTIKINQDPDHQDRLEVRYHIPKILNLDAVKVLPGYDDYVHEGLEYPYAKGFFTISKSNIGKAIVDLIRRIPSDYGHSAVTDRWNWN